MAGLQLCPQASVGDVDLHMLNLHAVLVLSFFIVHVPCARTVTHAQARLTKVGGVKQILISYLGDIIMLLGMIDQHNLFVLPQPQSLLPCWGA